MSKIIRLDMARLGELHGPVVALAPQDQDQVGDLAPDSPQWVWRPVDSSYDRAAWWEGSDYEGKPVPDFITLAPAAPLDELKWLLHTAFDASSGRIPDLAPMEALGELRDVEAVVNWFDQMGGNCEDFADVLLSDEDAAKIVANAAAHQAKSAPPAVDPDTMRRVLAITRDFPANGNSEPDVMAEALDLCQALAQRALTGKPIDFDRIESRLKAYLDIEPDSEDGEHERSLIMTEVRNLIHGLG